MSEPSEAGPHGALIAEAERILFCGGALGTDEARIVRKLVAALKNPSESLQTENERLKKCFGEVAAIAQEMNDARWGYSSDFVEVLDRLIAIGEAMQDEG